MAGVMRNAQTVNFNTQGGAGAVQDQTSYVRPDTAKYAGTEGRISTHTDVESSGFDSLLSAIAPSISKYGERALKQSQEQAYLDGQAAAAAGKSRDEVESNIFTRDWATAGFSDTKGRLAVADSEAQFAVDLKTLREQDPEKLKEYLAQRREKLLPLMEGMSLEARKGMLAQMATGDQHAIAKHNGEYQKYIIEQQGQAIQTSYSVANDAMNASKADPIAYDKATDSALANLYGNVLQNRNLPVATREKLLGEALSMSLATNNERLYEKARDIKGPDGTTLLDQLPFEQQASLAKAYQSSRKDTEAMRLGGFNTQRGLYEAKLDDPLSEPISWDQHNAFVQQGVQMGAISASDVTSLAKRWAEGNMKKQKGSTAAAAYAAGDVNTMFSLGMSEDDSAQAWWATQSRKGVPLADATTALAQIGLATGQQSAFKQVGKALSSSISMIGTGETIDPGQLAGVNSVLGTIEQAEKKGNLSAKTAFLSSFDDDTQARLLTYWDNLKMGKAPGVAAADAATQATQNATLSKQDKAALGAQHSKENAELVASIEPKGLFAQFWEKAVPDMFRSNDNISKDKIRAGQSWWENSERVEQAQARGKVALLEELNDISRTHPYMSASSRQSLALTRVASRSLQTDGGPLVLPKGQSIQSFFGVDSSVNADVVSSVLNTMHTPGKGNRTVYTVTGTGQMQWQEYGKDGALVNGGGTFDPRSISGAVRAEQDRLTEKYHNTDGPGVVRKGDDGAQVQYNGDNTVGLGTNFALTLRDDLVKFEGVRSKPYDDASGKVVNGKRVQTVGVGVSTTSDFYPKVAEDGSVAQADINKSFVLASNRAMKQANEAQQKLPINMQGKPAMRLFTQLAYQGGNVANSLIKAIADKSADALSILHDTPQYKLAHAERRAFYDEQFKAIIQ